MNISVQYDKEMQKMVLKNDDKLIAVLDAKEADHFKKEYEQALFQLELDYKAEHNDYAQIILEDFDMWLKAADDDEDEDWYEKAVLESDIMGLDIEVRWMTRLDHSEESIYLLKENGDYEYVGIPDSLKRNFTEAQIKFGQASSRQIRRCFDENVLKLIERQPNFVVTFCGVEVPREYLFSDEKELFFDFETSSDT